MAVLQVRNMDDDLYKALGCRAVLDNRSISQEVVCIIEKYLSDPMHEAATSDAEALKLAGSWDDPRSPDEIAAAIRSDRNTDRFQGGF